MNRRHFLSAIAASIPAMALDPERLLWVPGQRSYFDIHRPTGESVAIKFVQHWSDGDGWSSPWLIPGEVVTFEYKNLPNW